MKRTVNIWMQLLGFDKSCSDRGVSKFLERMGFTPESVCALMFHPDLIHLHRGMDTEYELFPDNCAYRAIPFNTERERQNWTNVELRELIRELKKQGIDFYIGIMGAYLKDRFHKEWLSEHDELRCCTATEKSRNLMCLKRFRDGSYYEDFFIEKLTETLVDYECAGIHLSDMFCPSDHLYVSDYSTDMTEQFIDYSKVALPPEVLSTMGDDSHAAAAVRRDYLWTHKRREWIDFYEWRWEKFFRKLSTALHTVDKKVWILGMYCSDPFETRYVYGFDTKKIMAAGVDCITANILPTSVHYEAPRYPYYFHRIQMDLPLLRTQINDGSVLSMIGVHDASEEWSMIDHAPVRLERDIYTTSSYFTMGESGAIPASDGVFLCLGDGIEPEKWSFLKKRLDAGLDADVHHTLSPLVLWSDTANEKMLDEYISTRRTTPHKQSFEIFKAGTPFGGAVKTEFISKLEDVLFVPNYDMLSDGERLALSTYPHPWVATVPKDYEIKGSVAEYAITDAFSDYPMSALAFGFKISDGEIAKITDMLSDKESCSQDATAPEREIHPPIEELPYRDISRGFIRACAELLRLAAYSRYKVSCNHPMTAHKLKNGKERLYVYNKYDNAYVNALVYSEDEIESAEIVSAFPILPVKFVDTEDKTGLFDYSAASKKRKCFQLKLAPDGLTIIDIKRKA